MADDLQAPQVPIPVQPPPDLGQASSNLPMLAPQNQPQPAPTTPPLAPQNQPPKPRPILLDLIKGMVNPTAQDMAGQRPTSRTQVFEQFLGQFLPSLAEGFGAARGPGAFGKGFAAAATTPYQMDVQRFQQQQAAQEQQARIAQQQAATQFQQEQATIQPRFDPQSGQFLGTMSQKGYEGYLAQRDKGAVAAQVGAKAKIETEQLKAMLLTGQVASVQTDESGNKIAFNKFGKPLGQLDGAIDTKFLTKYSNGIEYKEDANGNLVALPKTTVSGISSGGKPSVVPNVPAKTKTTTPGPAGPTVVPNFQGKNATQMMSGYDADGSMVAGTPQELQAAGINKFTKMDANDASKVMVSRQLIAPNGLFNLVNQDLQKLGAANLGPLASRWNDYMSGKVGVGPDFAALRTHMGLLGTALMQAHMGNKGGEGAMEHFKNLADYRISDAATLRSALAAEYRYVNEKAARPKQRTQ